MGRLTDEPAHLGDAQWQTDKTLKSSLRSHTFAQLVGRERRERVS
jgi:hypothetical protein